MPALKEFILQSSAADSFDDLLQLFQRAVGEFGYDIFVHSLLTNHPSIHKERSDHYVGKVMPGWQEHFIENEYWNVDPIRQTVFRNPGVCVWNDVPKQYPISRKQKTFLHEVSDAGLLGGMTVPLYGPCNEVAAMSVASSVEKIKPHRYIMSVVQALSHHFHSMYLFMHSRQVKSDLNHHNLTEREREILKWTAEGKSNTVIASILSVSENSVKFHLKNIFSKLNVSSRQAAVVRAIQAGFYTP